MKKLYALFFFFSSAAAMAQTICNPAGNLFIFSNYDGGTLNINVDVNIPNLKIGVVSYEGVAITIGGAFAANVTDVVYAGYDGSNVHCGSSISTSISGAPAGANTSINILPPSGLSNPNGYGSIICGYSCSITTNQGGCNTVDQIENYFLTLFSGSSLYAHKVQYGCWTSGQSLSAGGTCCATPLSISESSQQQINIYPNPAANELSITSSQAFDQSVCRVLSLTGQLMLLEQLNGFAASIDISALSSGIYFVEITDGGAVRRSRFVKE